MAEARGAYGGHVRVDISSSLTEIPLIDEMEFPVPKKNLVDATPHGGGGYQIMVKTGYSSHPEIKMTVFWDAADSVHQHLQTLDSSGATAAFEFESAHGEEMALNCFVTEIKRLTPKQGLIRSEITFQPIGTPVITAPGA